jgi:hypothetical protein
LHEPAEQDLNRAAISTTTHCLTGCAIGEIVGMVIFTAAGWSNFGSFTVSIVPGAINAGLGGATFWWSIVVGFAIAFGPAWAANRWLIARGKGNAVMHEYHAAHAGHDNH